MTTTDKRAQHTPGPWVKDYGHTRWHTKSTAPRPDDSTPTVAVYGGPGVAVSLKAEEKEENGRLIAAAPALLAALERAERVFRVPHGHYSGAVEAEVLRMMRAAIRQAKGEA